MSEDPHPTARFTSRADDYTRFRPDYPAAAFPAMLEGLGYPHMLTAADIGSGTGISARQLASFGPLVVAVEPNAAMREAGASHERVLPHEGRAEDTGLKAGSITLVLCAQAFHWFRADEALAEFRRILSGLGRLALMWNTRDLSDEATRTYTELISQAAAAPLPDLFVEPAAALAASPLFCNYRELTFVHPQRLSREGLLGRARSASYCPKAGPAYDTLAAGLNALFDSCAVPDPHSGQPLVTLRYRTQLYLAEPAFE